MEKICVVFGAGTLYEADKTLTLSPSSALVVAADGGRLHAESLGITPDVYVGDFDSSPAPLAGMVFLHPTEKDETDLYLAVRYGYETGCRTFHVYGALGGERFDHSVASLQTLAAFAKQGARVFLYDKNQIVTMIGCDTEVRFDADARGYVSLFAFGGEVCGVTAKGLKYPLENAALSPAFPLGVSNEFCGIPSSVSCREGLLMILYNRGIAAEYKIKE